MRHHNHPFENKYCTGCQQTTKHEVKESTFACLRCGVLKLPVLRRRTTPSFDTSRLIVATVA